MADTADLVVLGAYFGTGGKGNGKLKQSYRPAYTIDNYIKYSLDFLRPIKTAEAFEVVDWQSSANIFMW